MTAYKFDNVWTLEKGTLRHTIAQQCLISKGVDPKHKDQEMFTDNGDHTMRSLYEDMIQANIRAIRKQENDRLKL